MIFDNPYLNAKKVTKLNLRELQMSSMKKLDSLQHYSDDYKNLYETLSFHNATTGRLVLKKNLIIFQNFWRKNVSY